MAHIDELIARVKDDVLRVDLEREIKQVKARRDWGLVFERHRPEMTRLLDAPLRAGCAVWERRAAKPRRLRVLAVEGDDLVVVPEERNKMVVPGTPSERIARADVLFEKEFTEAVFPALEQIDSLRNGPADRPAHAVVCGENFHAISTLLTAIEGQVDCLYLDPPYNTGDRDWAYDNDFVDGKDEYVPSKWLAFMERRLLLGRRLLKPDGVMVVTIDEHEVIHLGMLLEQIFPEARIQMASIVINPIGQNRVGGLARVDEQAFFLFFGEAPAPIAYNDDLLNERSSASGAGTVRWERLLRGGPSSTREGHPGTFYPVLIDPERNAVVRAGPLLLEGNPDLDARVGDLIAAWPMRGDGSQGRWRIGPGKLDRLIGQGFVRLGGYDAKRKSWTVLYVPDVAIKQIEAGVVLVTHRDKNGVASLAFADQDKRKFTGKTVWNRSRHNAGVYGSALLSAFVGARRVFSFPKSLYAVADTLDLITHDNPDALIVDFFGGSGTTLHATMLLNARDEGRRRCVLVTNNEVNARVADALNEKGLFRGDPEFEAAGVYECATVPRIRAAVTGMRPDGQPAEGVYKEDPVLSEREYAEGFEENVEFFRLRYLDPVMVETGRAFRYLHPLLWLAADSVGEIEDIDPAARFAAPEGSPYAVLFHPAGVPGLLAALAARPEIKRVFIAASSDSSFSELSSVLPTGVKPVHFQQRFLDTLRGAAL